MEIFTVKTSTVRNVATTKKKSKSGGVFSIESDDGEDSSNQISTVSSINSINSLLSLQSLSSEELALQEALDQGEQKLDNLDDYLKSIAMGDQKKQQEALTKMARAAKSNLDIEDALARDILESIETLTQVELAKQRVKSNG